MRRPKATIHAVSMLSLSLDSFPSVRVDSCLGEDAFHERPIEIAAMGIRNREFDLTHRMTHVFVFPSRVWTGPPEYTQTANQFTPADGLWHAERVRVCSG